MFSFDRSWHNAEQIPSLLQRDYYFFIGNETTVDFWTSQGWTAMGLLIIFRFYKINILEKFLKICDNLKKTHRWTVWLRNIENVTKKLGMSWMYTIHVDISLLYHLPPQNIYKSILKS